MIEKASASPGQLSSGEYLISTFRCCVDSFTGVRLDDYVDVYAVSQPNFLAAGCFKCVWDSDFPIEMIPVVQSDFDLFFHRRVD